MKTTWQNRNDLRPFVALPLVQLFAGWVALWSIPFIEEAYNIHLSLSLQVRE